MGEVNGNMLVRDLIKAIGNKEIRVADLSNKYGLSERTIQKRIKGYSLVWDSKAGKYDFVGNDKNTLNITLDEAFKKAVNSNNKGNGKAKRNIKKVIDEIAVTTPEKEIRTNSNNNNSKNSKKEIDNIDRLLAGKKTKKAFRGFYLDSDVLEIIDNVDSGIKSELVNECLREIFRQKGLL